MNLKEEDGVGDSRPRDRGGVPDVELGSGVCVVGAGCGLISSAARVASVRSSSCLVVDGVLCFFELANCSMIGALLVARSGDEVAMLIGVQFCLR